MSVLTKRGKALLKAMNHENDLRALAVQVKNTEGPRAAACLFDAADKIEQLRKDLESDADG